MKEDSNVNHAQTQLKQHIKIVHLKIKPHKCDICLLSFGVMCDLKAHKLVHSREKPHSCKICFKKVSKMREHMLSLHTDDKQRPFQCDQCVKGFSSKKHLKHHEFSIHLKSRPFKCRFDCGMDYNDPQSCFTWDDIEKENNSSEYIIVKNNFLNN